MEPPLLKAPPVPIVHSGRSQPESALPSSVASTTTPLTCLTVLRGLRMLRIEQCSRTLESAEAEADVSRELGEIGRVVGAEWVPGPAQLQQRHQAPGSDDRRHGDAREWERRPQALGDQALGQAVARATAESPTAQRELVAGIRRGQHL